MKNNNVALKTMAMKAKLANLIRKELYQYSNDQFKIQYKGAKPITEEFKLKMFDKFYEAYREMDNDLRAYKHKRESKAKVQALREKNPLYRLNKLRKQEAKIAWKSSKVHI